MKFLWSLFVSTLSLFLSLVPTCMHARIPLGALLVIIVKKDDLSAPIFVFALLFLSTKVKRVLSIYKYRENKTNYMRNT